MKSISTSAASQAMVQPLNQVFAEVILGRPSAHCKHLGICKIERVYTNDYYLISQSDLCQRSDKLYALASLRVGDYFELAFERRFIDAACYAEHFSEGTFVLEETYTSDLDLMNYPIHLKKGSYQIGFSETMITVRFDL